MGTQDVRRIPLAEVDRKLSREVHRPHYAARSPSCLRDGLICAPSPSWNFRGKGRASSSRLAR